MKPNNVSEESKWEEKVDEILDKNTSALTKTGDADFNPPEIINFDKVIMDRYQASIELKSFIRTLLQAKDQEKQQSLTLKGLRDFQICREEIDEAVGDALKGFIERVEKEVIGEDEDVYDDYQTNTHFHTIRNRHKAEQRQALQSLREEVISLNKESEQDHS